MCVGIVHHGSRKKKISNEELPHVYQKGLVEIDECVGGGNKRWSAINKGWEFANLSFE